MIDDACNLRVRSNVNKINSTMILSLSAWLLLLLLAPFSLNATKGVDVSGSLDNYDFKDFMEAGYDGFVIFQGYRSNGTVNQYAINDSIGAYEAGFSNFDVYLSPCPKCNKTASQQVQEMGRFKVYSIIMVIIVLLFL